MGIFEWFSSDSRDCKSEILSNLSVNDISIPDPTNFSVTKKIVVNDYPIFWVNYPDAKNYEGNKILMYPKFFNTDFLQKRMDPHFFTEGDSPIARFEPTVHGWHMAQILAKFL